MYDFDPMNYNKVSSTEDLLYVFTPNETPFVFSHDENLCMAQVFPLPETYPYVIRLRLRRLGSLVSGFDFPPESWETLMTWFSNSPYPKNIRADQQRAMIFNPDNVEKVCEVGSVKRFIRFTDNQTDDTPWLWENEWDFFCRNVPSDKIVPFHDF